MGESSPRQSSLDGAAGSRKSSNLLHEDNRNAVAANTTGPSLSPSPARPVTGDEPDGASLTSTGKGSTAERPLGFRQALTTLWPRRKSPQPNAAQLDEVSRGPLGLRLLHEASEPMVEVIFVHGLRGGSTKTWRKGEDPGLFWPKAFLPADPDFQNASIYSFGYDSDWGSAKRSILGMSRSNTGTHPHISLTMSQMSMTLVAVSWRRCARLLTYGVVPRPPSFSSATAWAG